MIDLDPGLLNKRITVQEVSRIADGEGGFNETWSDVGTYWAEINPLSSKQIMEYKSYNVETTHKIRVRASVPVEEYNRILYGTREFEIITVENEKEANVVKWVTCRERKV